MRDPKNKIWKIAINSSLVHSENNWMESVSVEIANEDNVVFSSSTGQGNNNNFS
jgi:hypothetical protein